MTLYNIEYNELDIVGTHWYQLDITLHIRNWTSTRETRDCLFHQEPIPYPSKVASVYKIDKMSVFLLR